MNHALLLAVLPLLAPPTTIERAAASRATSIATSRVAATADVSAGAPRRPLHGPTHRPLDRGEFAELESGVGAASVVLDLPGLGAVRANLSRARLVAEDFRLETARVVRGRTVSQAIAPELPVAYAGSVEGVVDSRVYLGFGRGAGRGLVAGVVEIEGTRWWISSGPASAWRAGLPAMIAREDALAADGRDAARGFTCLADELAGNPALPAGGGPEGGVAGGAGCREFRVALDTDTEFTMLKFGGDVVRASQYAILLMGAASQVYERDVGVRLPVSYLRLWTGEDPWTFDAMVDQLYQYRDHWVANMQAVPRDLGHILCGRGLGGGVAWVGVACSYLDYAYGLSSYIGDGFPYPLVDNNGANWEPMVVCHEIGHNFGAPHTHSMNPPADGCGNNDCTLAPQGTIMSYCHLCAGGMTNIALHFHPYSIATMTGHVASTSCFDAGLHLADDAAATLEGAAVSVDPLANDAFFNCSTLVLAGFTGTTAHAGTVVLDPSAPNRLRYTPAPGYVGRDAFSYTVLDAEENLGQATVHVEIAPVLDQSYVEGATPGIEARWYALAGDTGSLPDFTSMTPYGTAVLANVEIASTDGPFSSSGRADLVAAVFEGWVSVPATGVWSFSSESDDGSRLLIDGRPVVSNDGLHGMVDRSGTVALEAGFHRIRVEFFENYGGAGEIVRWQGPGTARAVIPASAFWHGGTSYLLDLDGDGEIGAGDLAFVLAAWGPAAPGQAGDVDRNGVVDAGDLAKILAAWGT